MKPNKILFFKLGAIGDCLMTTPLVRQIRKNFPSAKIDYFIGKHSAPALDGNENIDEIVAFNENIFIKKNIFGLIGLIKQIRKRSYDWIFVLDKHWVFNLTAFFAAIPVRIGFDRMGNEGIGLTRKTDYGPIKHMILYYLDLAKAAGLSVDYKDIEMEIAISKNEEKWAAEFWKKNHLGKNAVGIAPGGAVNPGQKMFAKRWPAEKYAELCGALVKKGKQIVLIGGMGDEDAAKTILNKVKAADAVGKATIRQSAALIKRCKAFVCNDSGTMHLSSAVGAKTISLFGPTDPRRLSPIGKKNKYIWRVKEPAYDEIYGKLRVDDGSINKITVNEVLQCLA